MPNEQEPLPVWVDGMDKPGYAKFIGFELRWLDELGVYLIGGNYEPEHGYRGVVSRVDNSFPTGTFDLADAKVKVLREAYRAALSTLTRIGNALDRELAEQAAGQQNVDGG